MTTEEQLSNLIRSTEQRFIDYKQQIEYIGRNRDLYPPQDDLVIWLKQLVRDQKNAEETYLKQLQKEQQYLRQGLNPPFCYSK